MNIYRRLFYRLLAANEAFYAACRASRKHGDGKIPEDAWGEWCGDREFIDDVDRLIRAEENLGADEPTSD